MIFLKKGRVKQHITAEAESYMDSIEDQIQLGLVVEMEDEEGNRQSVNYIEDIEDAVYSMIYQ